MGEVPAIRVGFGADPETILAARYFAKVHAVEVTPDGYSATKTLAESMPNLETHWDHARELRAFPDGYAYYVEVATPAMQGTPTKVYEMVRACARVLACGGLVRLQIASSFAAPPEIAELTRRFQLQGLWFEGPDRAGLYHGLWRRMPMNWRDELTTLAGITAVDIRKIVNAQRTAPVVSARGRNLSVVLYVHGLPEEADVFDLSLVVGGRTANVVSVGPADSKGVKQIIADLPELEETGLVRVELFWMQERMGRPAVLRVVARTPEVPRLLSLHPARNGMVVAIVDDLADPEDFEARVDGRPAWGYEYECLDVDQRKFRIHFQLPDGVDGGECAVTVRLCRRELPPVPMQVAAPAAVTAEPFLSFVS